MPGSPQIFFATCEVSGDRHSAPVVAELVGRGFTVAGVGGPGIARAGAELIADSTNWGAMGVPETLRRAPGVYLQLARLKSLLQRRRPDVVVLVDAGFFNVRVARFLKQANISRVFYYFPPGSWRQQPRDWSGLAAITDCIATPFSRNAEYLRASGADAHWVGHPVVDEIQPVGDRQAFRRTQGLPEGEPVVAVMPGSRLAERRYIEPLMLKTMERIARAYPAAQFLWSPRPGSADGSLPARAQKLGCVTRVEDSHLILRASDLALLAMGTVTLEAAAALTPMVMTYEASALAKWIAGRILGQEQRYYGMPNLMLERDAVPELVPLHPGDKVSADLLADTALDLLSDAGKREAMVSQLQEVRGMLGDPGAARRTADLIEKLALEGPSR